MDEIGKAWSQAIDVFQRKQETMERVRMARYEDEKYGENSGLATEARVVRSAITEDLGAIEDRLGLLHKSLSILEGKLEIVLRNVYDDNESDCGPERESTSSLDESLRRINASIDNAVQFLNRLTNRIDL